MPVIMLGGSPPGTSPLNISGIQNYYDFTDSSMLYTDTGRTTPVSIDGDLVKGVTDQGPEANHLSEATNPPTYKTSSYFGGKAVRFDGTNDFLKQANNSTWFDVYTNDACTVMAVTYWDTDFSSGDTGYTGGRYIFGMNQPGTDIGMLGSNSGGQYIQNAVTTSCCLANGRKLAPKQTKYILTMIWDGNSTNSPNWDIQAWMGLNDTRTASLNTSGLAGAANISGVGAYKRTIGAAFNGTSWFWEGDIAEIATFNVNLPEADRQEIERRWAWKYSITLPY